MANIDNESALRRLGHGQKEMAASLRKLADRVEQLTPADVHEVPVWVQRYVEQRLAGSYRVLEAIDAKTGRQRSS